MEGGTLGIVSPPPVPAVRYPPPAPAHKEGAGVGFIARTPPPPESGGNEGACEDHERQIKRIDAAGRVGGTSSKMERLRERRRYHTDAMWRLGGGR